MCWKFARSSLERLRQAELLLPSSFFRAYRSSSAEIRRPGWCSWAEGVDEVMKEVLVPPRKPVETPHSSRPGLGNGMPTHSQDSASRHRQKNVSLVQLPTNRRSSLQIDAVFDNLILAELYAWTRISKPQHADGPQVARRLSR